jgi:hypothetical protein
VTNQLYNRSFEYKILTEFVKVLRENVKIDRISDLNRGNIMVRGTFGNIYESTVDKYRCHKACRVDSHHLKQMKVRPLSREAVITDDKDEVFRLTAADYKSGKNGALNEFMYEIVNYIIWRSLILYIHDMTYDDSDGKYPQLDRHIATIHRIYYIEENAESPILSIRSPVAKPIRFRLGYEIDRLPGDVSFTLRTMVDRIDHYSDLKQLSIRYLNDPSSRPACFDGDDGELEEIIENCINKVESKKRIIRNIFIKTFAMFDEFRFYDRYGITLIHRDATTKNVMVCNIDDQNETETEVMFVDFSALKTHITFGDGTEIVIGHLFDERSNRMPFTHYDHVLFLLFAKSFRERAINVLGKKVMKELSELLKIDIYKKILDTSNSTSVWLHSYRVIFDGEEFSRNAKKIFEFDE